MAWLKSGRNPPRRSVVLMAAREWGTPPWEVARAPAKWVARWLAEQDIRATLDNPMVFPDDGHGD